MKSSLPTFQINSYIITEEFDKYNAGSRYVKIETRTEHKVSVAEFRSQLIDVLQRDTNNSSGIAVMWFGDSSFIVSFITENPEIDIPLVLREMISSGLYEEKIL